MPTRLLPGSRSRLLALVLLVLLAGCNGIGAGRGSGGEVASEGGGQLRVQVSGAMLAASGITRATMTIGPGSGPRFTPFTAPLSESVEGGWSAFISGVPVGTQREIEVVAYDSGEQPLFQGSAFADIAAGSVSEVAVLLEQLGSASQLLSSPVVSISVSAGAVRPGESAQLDSRVSDPAGQALSYRWAASCGTFSSTSQPSTIWTAPTQANRRCQLAFTAGNQYLSTTVEVPVDVLTDVNTRSVAGRRMTTCWESPKPGWSAPALSTIAASDLSQSAAPDALAQTSPGAWATYPGGRVSADGSFYQGTFAGDGGFYIPGLPLDGPYLLSFLQPDGVRLLVETASTDIDLGADQLGRCNGWAAPGTQVAFQLSLNDPWETEWSELQASVPAVDSWKSLASGPDLPQGSTSATVTTAWSEPLINPADVLWVNQLSPQLDPSGYFYRSSTGAAGFSSVSSAGGATTTVAAALAPVAQTGQVAIHWEPIQFEAWQQDLGPPARMTSSLVPTHRVSVVAVPFAVRYPAPAPSGSLELARLEVPAGTLSVHLDPPLQYGQFLPAWWEEWREVRYSLSVGYQAAGASDWVYLETSIGNRAAMPAPASTMLPVLTPVRSPLINGKPALADQIQPVTDKPTFSWSPPGLGSPTVYALEIFALRAIAGRSTAQLVLRYLTASTTAALPPGALAPGEVYFARIVARATDVPFQASPLRYSPQLAEATAFTGTFSP